MLIDLLDKTKKKKLNLKYSNFFESKIDLEPKVACVKSFNI